MGLKRTDTVADHSFIYYLVGVCVRTMGGGAKRAAILALAQRGSREICSCLLEVEDFEFE